MDKRKLKKFIRICNELAEFMNEIHSDNKNIELFVAGESYGTSIMLIDNKGEDDNYWRNNIECILAEVNIPYADCGGI